MELTRTFLESVGLPRGDRGDLPSSTKRFATGEQFRVEIPSVEDPEPFRAALDAAKMHDIRFQRISHGSGMMLLTDVEITEMVALGAAHEVEVCLFVGPRAGWDVGIQVSTSSGRVAAGALRGPTSSSMPSRTSGGVASSGCGAFSSPTSASCGCSPG